MPTFGSLIRAKHGGKPGGSRKVEALVRQPSRRKETKANREAFDDNEARSHFSCIAQACDGSSRRKLRLYAAAQSGFLKTGCARRRRRQSVLAELQPDRPHRDDAEQGRRISSFRLERVLVGAVAAGRPRL